MGRQHSALQVLIVACVVVTLSLIGYALARALSAHWISQPIPGVGGAFFNLFARSERLPLLVLAAFTCGAAGYLLSPNPRENSDHPEAARFRIPVWVVAVAVVAGCLAASHMVLLGYPLSMDEFNAVFQAKIFATGRIAAPVPSEWWEVMPALKPISITYRPNDHVWLSGYLPGYAGMRAPFELLGLGAFLNPLLAGASVLAISQAARRMQRPTGPSPTVAVVLLATSAQFLLTSASSYSMPAHLLLNLCWFLLYLGSRRTCLAAPWVGAIALGLHNPFPHALFVAPFLLRMLRQRRWGMAGYHLAVYGVASLCLLAWWKYALPASTQAQAVASFGVPNMAHLVSEGMSLALVLGWQAPVFAIGLGMAMIAWRRLGVVERDLGMGILLTLGFYFFYLTAQGHGWGYRYFYPVLGNAVLLSAVGVSRACQPFGTGRLRRVVAASSLLALACLLPLRLRDAADFTLPFATAFTALSSSAAAVVLVPTDSLWYGFDLIRTDPLFRGPVLVSTEPGLLPRGELERLEGAHQGRTARWSAESFRAFGMTAGAPVSLNQVRD